MTRNEIIQLILNERTRQFDLPGREFDMDNSPNDWIAISSAYLHDGTTRNHVCIDVEEYRDALIKASAVILAALEHIDTMEKKSKFSETIMTAN